MGERSERPERVFPGRTDPWFIAAMVIVAGGLSAGVYRVFPELESRAPMGLARAAARPGPRGLAALPVRSNRLELYGDRLVVVYAGMRSVIPYAHVRGVRRTGRSGRGRPTRSTASISRRPTTATPSSR